MPEEGEEFEGGEMSVPTHLLELHIQQEDDNMTQEQYEEVYGAKTDSESSVGSPTSEE